MAAAQILIAEAEDGPGYCISIIPPPSGPGHDCCFGDYLKARAYGRLLRIGHGWEIVDRVDAATRKAAERADQARRNG